MPWSRGAPVEREPIGRPSKTVDNSRSEWATRRNANVDRVACSGLVKRFVDEDAEFLYVAADEVMKAAEERGAIPCDVKDVEFGHVDGRCSVESIILKYGLEDRTLVLLSKIVHGADVSQDRRLAPEAAGPYAVAHGFALVHADDDQKKIRFETPMYDAHCAWRQELVAK